MKIIYGGMVGDARGSIGGMVASRNHYGAYFRKRTVPTNPSSARQLVVRGHLTNLSQRWSQVLTDGQRDQWAVYAAAVPYINSLGVSIHLTAPAMYIACNAPRLQAGLAVVDAGPVILLREEVDPLFAASASEATQKVNLVFDDTLPWSTEPTSALIMSLSRPANPTRIYVAGPWRYMDKTIGITPGGAVSPSLVDSPWAFQEGQSVTARARISRADGRLSPFFQSTCIVVA